MNEEDHDWLQRFRAALIQDARRVASWMSYVDWENKIQKDLNYIKFVSLVGEKLAQKSLEACFYLYFKGSWR